MRLDSNIASRDLVGANSTKTFERGTFVIEKGRKLLAAYLKVTVPVQNTTGGALALTDANRQLLLSLFLFTVTLGMKSKALMKPFIAVDGRRIHHEARRFLNSEIEGYADSVTGLATSVNNAATANLVFYLPIPLGVAWFLENDYRHMWGLGPSLAQLLEIQIKQTGTAIAAGWAINGTTTFEVLPMTAPCKGDLFGPIPIYEEKDEVNKRLQLPPGLPLAIDERTNVQASNPLTRFSLNIDDMQVFAQLKAADVIVGLNDSWKQQTAGYLGDRESICYTATDGDSPFDKIPTGAPELIQDVKDLATFKAAYTYVPVLDGQSLAEHIDYIAKNIRQKTVKAVCLADVGGWKVPDNLRPFIPSVLFDEADKEFEMFGGLTGYPDKREPEMLVPKSLLDRAKSAAAQHEKNGEKLAAKDVEKRIAVMAPGAIEGTRGFSSGASSILNAVRGWFR